MQNVVEPSQHHLGVTQDELIGQSSQTGFGSDDHIMTEQIMGNLSPRYFLLSGRYWFYFTLV